MSPQSSTSLASLSVALPVFDLRHDLHAELRIGLRHIEIDINMDVTTKDIITCHSPFPLDPVILLQV